MCSITYIKKQFKMKRGKIMSYILGMDLGIASIGWALLQKNDEGDILRIVDLGSRVFNKLEDKDGKLENVDRRGKRSTRRQRRRKQRRLLELNDLFMKYFGKTIKDIDLRKIASPFALKVKGINEKLSDEEMMSALYHYMKYRGFKSSRKVEDQKDKDNKKLLSKINEIRSFLVDGKTITEVLLEKYENQPIETRRMHNTEKAFYLTVSRDMYLTEIEKIFEKQISMNNCNKNFKEDYLVLYNRQRDFSEGPGLGSPFGASGKVSFIEKMVGKCRFDGLLRAPKGAYSSEAFILLSFLNNVSYKKTIDSKYTSFSAEELKKIFEVAKNKKEISYKDIFKAIDLPDVYRIKGLDLSKKQYISCMNKFKKDNNIDITTKLNLEQMEEFSTFSKKELMDKKLNVSMQTFYSMKKAFLDEAKKSSNKKEIIEFANNYDNYDAIAEILLFNKTDDRVKAALVAHNYPEFIINIVQNFESIKKTINLSLPICKKIIPFLLMAKTYDKAISELGYVHSGKKEVETCEYLPEIDIAMEGLGERLTNPNVRHTLVFMRQIINELTKKYGAISEFNIELSRELKKSREQRLQMTWDMRDNQDKNMGIKQTLLNKYPNKFSSLYDIKKNDIIKYQLFVEQNQLSAYTNAPITENSLFDDNMYQIDHIVPYSRSYDDSYTNKVLVETKQNADKGNRLPYEAFDKVQMETIKSFISKSAVSRRKIDNLLRTELDEDFINRNSNDASYMARLAKKLIEAYLQPKSCVCPSGAVTDKLKHMWRLKGHTHSYFSENYRNNSTYIFQRVCINKDSISLSLIISDTKQEKVIELKKVEQKPAKEGKEKIALPYNVMRLNEAIDFFFENPSLLEASLKAFEKKPIYMFIEKINLDTHNVNELTVNANLLTIASEIELKISQSRLEKDRSNDLHHALDAAVIAATTPKMIYRITEYYKDEKNSKIVDEKTGEVRDNFEKFPKPYDDFVNELLIRVYERNEEKLINELNKLDIYKEKPLERRDVHVLWPARLPEKYYEGAFTAETFFGCKKGILTKRISVDKLNEKNVEKIFELNGSNKVIYEACKEWIKNKKGNYPYHPTKARPIKKVLIVETTDIDSRVKVGNRFASNDNCVRVDVYKKQGDERLFFVPVYYYQIATEKLNKKLLANNKETKRIVYEIMWGQGKNSQYVSDSKLQEYTKIASLPRYSLIEVELNNGGKGLCYSAGATSGKFEVYSVLGDGSDLVNSKLFTSIRDNQFTLTVSTIKTIKVRNISILGKIS